MKKLLTILLLFTLISCDIGPRDNEVTAKTIADKKQVGYQKPYTVVITNDPKSMWMSESYIGCDSFQMNGTKEITIWNNGTEMLLNGDLITVSSN